eukprot:3155131-Amphidinium_carterae.1
MTRTMLMMTTSAQHYVEGFIGDSDGNCFLTFNLSFASGFLAQELQIINSAMSKIRSLETLLTEDSLKQPWRLLCLR